MKIRLALFLLFASGAAQAGSEVTLDAADVVACAEDEADVAICVPNPVCDPDWAYFHREACAEAAEAAVDDVIAVFRDRLAAVLGDVDPKGALAAEEEGAHDAWARYRDAHCAIDRSVSLDPTGAAEARAYCRIGHAVQRLATVRADLDRFEFMRAASK
ncbi:MAG: hypothetical protein AAF322_13895 [Pseudomonadota bacterium]